MKAYNPDQIVNIVVRDFRNALQFYYQKHIHKSFWNKEVKEGIYIHLIYDRTEPQDAERWGVVLKDGIVKWKPRVEITFSDESVKEVIFENYESAKEYYLKLKSEHKLIDL